MNRLEKWSPVAGYEGLYEVSNEGRVRSIDRTVRHMGNYSRLSGRMLVQHTKKTGYKLCALSRDGVVLSVRVHILVAAAFISARPDGKEIRHLDGDPANNHVDNLRWGTHAENMADLVLHKRHWNTVKTVCKWGHLLVAPNLYTSGGRHCRACALARASASTHPQLDHQTRSNHHYNRIMKRNSK